MVEMDTMGSVGRITDRESMALQREPMKTGIRRSPNHSSGLLVLLLLGVLSQAASGQQGVVRNIPDRPDQSVQLELTELFRVGSLNGADDSFGRVMSAALSPSGRLFIADDQQRTVIAFDARGRFVKKLGRQGSGPGEFQQPWLVAVDPHDSVFVWDAGLARVSVFGPGLQYIRSFRVPTYWAINSMAFLSSGEIAIAALGGADEMGVQVIDRTGAVLRAVGEVPRQISLAGFDTSLLGGNLAMLGRDMVYSRKSPYELLFYRRDELIGRCRGAEVLTTRPQDAVEIISGQGAALRWNKYVHSTSVILIDSTLALNVIMDPTRDSRTVDLITRDCRLVSRTQLTAPVTVVDKVAGRIAAVSNIEYPEVIVYTFTVSRKRP
jgi:hypothetical protein